MEENKVKLKISRDGLKQILTILDKEGVRATFFTTAYFALKNKRLIKKLQLYKHKIQKTQACLQHKHASFQIASPTSDYKVHRLRKLFQSINKRKMHR